MLPPEYAALSLTGDPEGSDHALAGRTVSACAARGVRTVAVAGVQRTALLVALARAGLAVVGYDASRTALRATSDVLRRDGVAEHVTLLAADPRDVDIPGGVGAALIPSSMWRLLLTEEAQAAALGSLRRALAPRGLLLLDVDRPPDVPRDTEIVLRRDADGREWRVRRVGGSSPGPTAGTSRSAEFRSVAGDGPVLRRLTAGSSRGAESRSVAGHGPAFLRLTVTGDAATAIPLDVAAGSPEDAAALARRTGFVVTSCTDARDGSELGPASARMWLVCREESA